MSPKIHRKNNRSEAARLLSLHGGEATVLSTLPDAMESTFDRLRDRYGHLTGRSGYRAMLEHAHAAALESHSVLEGISVRSEKAPFFHGLDTLLVREDPGEVWDTLVTLLEEFITISGSMAPDLELDGPSLPVASGVPKAPQSTNSGSGGESEAGKDRGKGKRQGMEEEEGEGGHGSRSAGADGVEEYLEGTKADGEHGSGNPGAEGVEENYRGTTPDGGGFRVLVMDRDLRACQETGRSLDRAGEFQVVGNATTAEEVEQVVAVDDLDFVVASRDLPTGEILEVCRWIREHHEDRPPHVIVTGLPPDEDVILRYLEAGAAGFTLEEFSVGGLRLVMRLIARGESVFPLRLQHLMALRVSELAELVRERGLEPDLLGSLTRREMEVLELLERNLTNREIAERLYVSEGTVKSHVHQVLKKLRAGDRKEAVRVLRLQRVAPGRLAAMMEAQKEKEKERG